MAPHEHPSLRALDEIEELLEAYADSHLSPTSPVLARMRRTIMSEAASVSATRAAERRLAGTAAGSRGASSWLPRLRMPRPVFAAGFSAVLAISTGAAVLAAPAGSPFYNARIVLETMFLPTELDARLASHEQLLEARLTEAEAAAARGDTEALTAALAAFDAEVEQALAEIGSDADRLAKLESMLAKHVAVLTALEAKVPEQASVDRALENSQKAIAKIKDKAKEGKPGKPAGGQPTNAPGGPPDNRPGGRP